MTTVLVPVPETPVPERRPQLVADHVSAWFGDHQVLDDICLTVQSNSVTALIGPSGCGKSTFLRTLNRMHELVPGASLAGRVLLDGHDVYERAARPTEVRRAVGMVFQKANPFPAMSIADNVLAGLLITGRKVRDRDDLIERSLRRAGLWKEVQSRLGSAAGTLSGGQQQRLCIARALAVDPQVLLMDEPCSALDPSSTRRVEETIQEVAQDIAVVIVTHNMQQASRVSQRCAFFLAEDDRPGRIVEQGQTYGLFHSPSDQRTADYVAGRFG